MVPEQTGKSADCAAPSTPRASSSVRKITPVAAISGATAREVKATGIDWIFAPTVAVARDYRWGRTYESYSSDETLVAPTQGVW